MYSKGLIKCSGTRSSRAAIDSGFHYLFYASLNRLEYLLDNYITHYTTLKRHISLATNLTILVATHWEKLENTSKISLSMNSASYCSNDQHVACMYCSRCFIHGYLSRLVVPPPCKFCATINELFAQNLQDNLLVYSLHPPK